MQQNAKNKNNSPKPNNLTALSKYFVIINESNQVDVETRAVAVDFTFVENNSDNMAHGKGPKPMLKKIINMVRDIIGRNDNASTLTSCFLRMQNTPSGTSENTIPTPDSNSTTLRPHLQQII